MPTNAGMERCISSERGALVFWSPEAPRFKPGARVQIIDVFTLQVVTGYTRDPQGRLLLEASPSLAEGRHWAAAKASQLIRNDARPQRWVVLHLDRLAWGLFWAGGGLQRCREVLMAQSGGAVVSDTLVPVIPEALLRLALNLNLKDTTFVATDRQRPSGPARSTSAHAHFVTATGNQTPLHDRLNDRLHTRKRHRLMWKTALIVSLGWIAVLGITASRFQSSLDRHDRMLENLLQRTDLPPQHDSTAPLR